MGINAARTSKYCPDRDRCREPVRLLEGAVPHRAVRSEKRSPSTSERWVRHVTTRAFPSHRRLDRAPCSVPTTSRPFERPYRPRPRLPASSPVAPDDRLNSQLEQIRKGRAGLDLDGGAPRAGVLRLAAGNGGSPTPGPSGARLCRGPSAARHRPPLRVNQCPRSGDGRCPGVRDRGPRSIKRAPRAALRAPGIRRRTPAIALSTLRHFCVHGRSSERHQEQQAQDAEWLLAHARWPAHDRTGRCRRQMPVRRWLMRRPAEHRADVGLVRGHGVTL